MTSRPGEGDTTGHADHGAVTILKGPALNSGSNYTTSGVTPSGARLGSVSLHLTAPKMLHLPAG